MKKILRIFLILVLLYCLSYVLDNPTGQNILITTPDFSITLSKATALMLGVVLFFSLHWLLNLYHCLVKTLPYRIQHRRQEQSAQRIYDHLAQALITHFSGQRKQPPCTALEPKDVPGLSNLAKTAYELLSIQSVLSENLPLKTLATPLTPLTQKTPLYDQLKLRTAFEKSDWPAAWSAICNLHTQYGHCPQYLPSIEESHQVLSQCLQQHHTLNSSTLFWKQQPKNIQNMAQYRLIFLQHCLNLGAHAFVRKQISYTLAKQPWDAALAKLYGLCNQDLKPQDLGMAEHWLEHESHDDPTLYLSLSQLCQALQLWGKSRDYLEAGLEKFPQCAQLHLSLAQLLEKQYPTENPSPYYRDAALLNTQPSQIEITQGEGTTLKNNSPSPI